MRILDNGIEIFGVSDNLALKSNCFKEFDFQFVSRLEDNNVLVGEVLSCNVMVGNGDMDVIKTPIMHSNDGVYLSGYKLKVELIINTKTKYIVKTPTIEVRISTNKIVKTIYIALPMEHNGYNMIDLLRRRKIIITPYIEDIYCEVRNFNLIYTNVSAVVDAELID